MSLGEFYVCVHSWSTESFAIPDVAAASAAMGLCGYLQTSHLEII